MPLFMVVPHPAYRMPQPQRASCYQLRYVNDPVHVGFLDNRCSSPVKARGAAICALKTGIVRRPSTRCRRLCWRRVTAPPRGRKGSLRSYSFRRAPQQLGATSRFHILGRAPARFERRGISLVAPLAGAARIAAIARADENGRRPPQRRHAFARRSSRDVFARIKHQPAAIGRRRCLCQRRARAKLAETKHMLSEYAARHHATPTAAIAWRAVLRFTLESLVRDQVSAFHHVASSAAEPWARHPILGSGQRFSGQTDVAVSQLTLPWRTRNRFFHGSKVAKRTDT